MCEHDFHGWMNKLLLILAVIVVGAAIGKGKADEPHQDRGRTTSHDRAK